MALSSGSDQEAECLRVLTASNHFEVLQLEVAVVQSDVVRKHYRRIALRVHPDKNSSPDAEEAFKTVSLAYDYLSDETEQQYYLDELTQGRHSKQYDQHSASGTSAADQERGRRKKPFVPKRKWWEHKSWTEVEAEIKRQEEEWKEHIAHQVAEYQERKEMKSAFQKRRRARVHQRLAPLYAKYGLQDDFSERNDEFRREARESSEAAYARRNERHSQHAQCVGAQATPNDHTDSTKPACPLALCEPSAGNNSLEAAMSIAASLSAASQCNSEQVDSNASSISEAADSSQREPVKPVSQSVLCQLCSRKFRDDSHFKAHVQFSKLHQNNLTKYMQQSSSSST